MSSLKINRVYREGGIGIVLDLETITDGVVRTGFVYQIEGKGLVTIKNFENNFCPLEFSHPSSGVYAHVDVGFSFKELEENMILTFFTKI